MSIRSRLRGQQGSILACGINPDAVHPHGDLDKRRDCFKARTIRPVADDPDLLSAP